MFRILRRDRPAQAAVRELKRIRQIIRKEGGAAKICYTYWKFLEESNLFTTLGISFQENAPYPRSVAIVSSLDLLNSWKLTPEGTEGKELLEALSKTVYVSAMLSLTVEDGERLFAEATGGRFTVELDSERLSEADLAVKTEIARRREEAEAAWASWCSSGFDILDAIRRA